MRPPITILALLLVIFGALQPASAEAPAPTSCAILGVDDQCEAWISADVSAEGAESTAGGLPMWMNEQVMGISPDSKTVYATGIELPGILVTHAYSADTGAVLWTNRYKGTPEFRYVTPESLSVSPDGRHVYVLALTQEDIGACIFNVFYANNHGTTVVLSFDSATGAVEWSDRTDQEAPTGTLTTCALSTALSPDGGTIYTAGWQYVQKEEKLSISALLTALDTSTGAQLWEQRVSNETSPARAPRLALSPDGSTLFAAITSIGSPDLWRTEVKAFDVSGTPELLWSVEHPGEGFWLSDLDVSPDGGQVLSVQHRGQGLGAFLHVTAHDASDGSVLWTTDVTGPGNPVQADYVYGWHHYQPFAFSPDSRTAYVTGSVSPRVGVEGVATSQYTGGFITAALDLANGSRKWTSMYRSPTTFGTVLGTAIASSPGGKQLFVTGTSTLGPAPTGLVYRTFAASTVSYDAETGEQIWVGIDLDNPGSTDSVVVSPDGRRVFVAGDGAMNPSSSKRSMAVRAYDTEPGFPV